VIVVFSLLARDVQFRFFPGGVAGFNSVPFLTLVVKSDAFGMEGRGDV
jgi:hypothetical protein